MSRIFRRPTPRWAGNHGVWLPGGQEIMESDYPVGRKHGVWLPVGRKSRSLTPRWAGNHGVWLPSGQEITESDSSVGRKLLSLTPQWAGNCWAWLPSGQEMVESDSLEGQETAESNSTPQNQNGKLCMSLIAFTGTNTWNLSTFKHVLCLWRVITLVRFAKNLNVWLCGVLHNAKSELSNFSKLFILGPRWFLILRKSPGTLLLIKTAIPI